VSTDPPPSLRILAPAAGQTVLPGSTLTIEAQAEDNVQVVSVQGKVVLGGVSVLSGTNIAIDLQNTSLAPGSPWGTSIPVPAGAASLEIQLTATDNLGATARATLTVAVRSAPLPEVTILLPASGATFTQGDPLTIRAQVMGTGQVTKVVVELDGQAQPATRSGDHWVLTGTVPVTGRRASTSEVSAQALPHVFVGSATVGGAPAADGAVVTAWLEGDPGADLTIRATATDSAGNQGAAAVTLKTRQPSVQAGQTTISEGGFTVVVNQLVGASFNGKKVTFKIGDRTAAQSGIWQQGGADILDLTALR
jgi:hypothetical protein